MLKKLFSFIFCVFVIASCTENSHNIQIFEQNIMRYNELLVRGYAEMNMTPLREVATAGQIQKVYHHMAALGESGVRMESELKDIQILDVAYDKENIATVITKEIWDYQHIHIDTNKSGNKIEGIIYELTYTLNKENDKWIVSGVESTIKNDQ